MITPYDIDHTQWTAISTAGQSGTCWLDEENDNAGGQLNIRVTHSASGTPPDTAITNAKRVYRSKGNTDIMILEADSDTDIFYARGVNPGDTARIQADMF